jgi:hypothetical protein
MDIVVNDYLTWQRAEQGETASAPIACSQYYPDWWKSLRGNLSHYVPESGNHRNHTARLCHGLRGTSQLGYTVALDQPLENTRVPQGEKSWRHSWLMQEMLHGSQWAKKSNDEFVWARPRILAWPWRAKMAPGWRLLITAYNLDWSDQYHAFTGYVEANHGSGFWGWSQPQDPACNYYNVETVFIMRADADPIPAGKCIFSMVPVYEPDYVPRPYLPYPF